MSEQAHTRLPLVLAGANARFNHISSERKLEGNAAHCRTAMPRSSRKARISFPPGLLAIADEEIE
jgi:hypothetical protein